MSGIAGILQLDGAPVDGRLLRRMTAFLAFRGPDAQQLWLDGPVGFGHTLLRTTEESEHEHQPFTLDHRLWIVADARVDARRELLAKLEDKRHSPIVDGVTDVELILRAYEVWGDGCVDHLLGDFAFAIWDGPRKRLFCARDHLGVKPFFYARIGDTVVFSGSLDCVRQHPLVSDTLNDEAIADFLLFNLNQNLATTSFADIHRLAPAHRAVFSTMGVRLDRYWALPADEPIYFRRARDYEDGFRELLEAAVEDRLRCERVGVFMSGGLDSGTLAAIACRILRRKPAGEVGAFTWVWEGFDNNEKHYAGTTAAFLKIPITFNHLSENVRNQNSFWLSDTPELLWNPMSADSQYSQYYRALSSYARVCFDGEVPDNALQFEWQAHLKYLAGRRRYGRMLHDVGLHVLRHRRIPLVPTIPRMLGQRLFGRDWSPTFAVWLNESLERRLNLSERWRLQQKSPAHPGSLRPAAYRSFAGPLWDGLFRGWYPEATTAELEVRYPYLDLRLLRYMLSVPAIPWCRSKYLVRRAMRGELPDNVLRRRKSPLTRDPEWESTRGRMLLPLEPTPALEHYIDVRSVPTTIDDMVRFRTDSRPYGLNHWLQSIQPAIYSKDVIHEATANTAS